MLDQRDEARWALALPAPLKIGVPILLVLSLVWWTQARPPVRYDAAFAEELSMMRAQLVDTPAQPFSLPALNGSTIDLGAFRGEWVFLNFWASWCEPCRDEMPAMARLAESMRGRPFKMVAISIDEDPTAMTSFLSGAGISTADMIVLHDPSGMSARSYGTLLLPETYWIDPSGQIAARFQGDYPWDSSEVRRALEQTMARPWKPGRVRGAQVGFFN